MPLPVAYFEFNPIPLMVSNPVLWLDTSVPTGVCTNTTGTTPASNNGDSVAFIKDRSTSGFNHIQANSAYRPSYIKNIINGKNTIGCGVTGNNVYSNSSIISGPSDYSVFLALQHPFYISAYHQSTVHGTPGGNGYWEMATRSDFDYRWIQRYDSTGTNSTNLSIATGTITPGSWNVYSNISGTNNSIYRNGILATSTTRLAQSQFAGGSHVLGCVSSNGNNPYSGCIGEIIVYASALSDSNRQLVEYYLLNKWQINRIITGNLVMYLDAGLPTSYPTTGGANWVNLMTASNCALSNTPTYTANPAGFFTFNGTNQYVSLGTPINGATSFTWCAWIKTTLSSTFANYFDMPVIAGTIQGSGTTQDALLGVNSGKLAWFDEFGGSPLSFDTGTLVNDGNWHYVCVTRSTTSLVFYVDGVQVNSTTTGSSGLNSLGMELAKANWTGNTFYSGSIGSFQIYNTNLSAANILQNFTAMRYRYGV